MSGNEALEELQRLVKQPLPGGRGFQASREARMQHLHEKVINELIDLVVEVNSPRDLAEMYLEQLFGDEFGRYRLVLTDDFQEMWKDYHPEDHNGQN